MHELNFIITMHNLVAYDLVIGAVGSVVYVTRLIVSSPRAVVQPGSIPGQGKIMNVPVLYHEVNMVLWALLSNV